MKKKITLCILSSIFVLFSYAQVTLRLGSIENAEPGTFINVPLVVTGLSTTGQSFIGIEILFSFQESIITYDTLANSDPLTPINQWLAGSIPGKVSANWLEPTLTPINVDDNSILVEFVFYYSGGQTDLSIDQSATIVYDAQGNPIQGTQFLNGIITQAQGSGNSVWNGTAVWSTPANWSNGIPGDSTDAVLNTGTVDLTSGGVCRNLTINSGVSLIIQPGYSLTVNGDLTNNGEILINSDSLIQGSLIVKGIITQSGVSEMVMQVYNGISYMLSSPVQGASASMFTGSGTASSFDESANTWSELSPFSILAPGAGYAFGSSGNSTLNFNGAFNTSTLTFDIPYTSQGNFANEGWSLIGNPFTSSLDADNYMSTVNADKAIYVWDGHRYRIWNGTAGNIPNGIIPPLTGFFVKANAANAKVTFSENGRIHDFSHYGGAYTAPSNVLPLSIHNFDDETFEDIAYLQIETASSTNYDGAYDAFKLRNLSTYPEIFLHDQDNNRLAISAIPEATEVNAGFRAPFDGTYLISAETFNFLPEHPVYLIDQELEITKDLRTEDYVFIATAGDHPDRFKIVLTGLGTNDLPENDGLVVYSKQGSIWINSLKQFGKSRVIVYDLSGRLVAQTQEMLEPGSLTSIRGVTGMNILSVESATRVFRFKIFIR